jgi:nuclear pore complex protein Nup205
VDQNTEGLFTIKIHIFFLLILCIFYFRQVQDFFTEIRQSLADIVFCLAAQNGLCRDDILLLVNYLSSVEQVDNVNVTLFMALLYAIDISAIVRTEESEDVVRLLPITSESAFVATIQKRLTEPLPWKNIGLQASVQLAWAVTLATFRSLSSGLCAPIQMQVDEDEAILDVALEGKALNFLSHLLQTKNHIYKEEFYLRRLHSLVTDLIVQMPLKIKDLRNKADEVARNIFVYQQEGLEPPSNLPLDFQWLLNFIAVLYGEDPLELELCLEFWSSDMANAGVNYRYMVIVYFEIKIKTYRLFNAESLSDKWPYISLFVWPGIYYRLLSTFLMPACFADWQMERGQLTKPLPF